MEEGRGRAHDFQSLLHPTDFRGSSMAFYHDTPDKGYFARIMARDRSLFRQWRAIRRRAKGRLLTTVTVVFVACSGVSSLRWTFRARLTDGLNHSYSASSSVIFITC